MQWVLLALWTLFMGGVFFVMWRSNRAFSRRHGQPAPGPHTCEHGRYVGFLFWTDRAVGPVPGRGGPAAVCLGSTGVHIGPATVLLARGVPKIYMEYQDLRADRVRTKLGRSGVRFRSSSGPLYVVFLTAASEEIVRSVAALGGDTDTELSPLDWIQR